MEGPAAKLQRTLALIKPDAVAEGRADEIMHLAELEGFTVVVQAKIQVWHSAPCANCGAAAAPPVHRQQDHTMPRALTRKTCRCGAAHTRTRRVVLR